MVDFGKAEARYVRLTFTGGQKNGFGGAVWNVKVFGGIEEALPQQWLGLTAADWDDPATDGFTYRPHGLGCGLEVSRREKAARWR